MKTGREGIPQALTEAVTWTGSPQTKGEAWAKNDKSVARTRTRFCFGGWKTPDLEEVGLNATAEKNRRAIGLERKEKRTFSTTGVGKRARLCKKRSSLGSYTPGPYNPSKSLEQQRKVNEGQDFIQLRIRTTTMTIVKREVRKRQLLEQQRKSCLSQDLCGRGSRGGGGERRLGTNPRTDGRTHDRLVWGFKGGRSKNLTWKEQ